MADGRIVIDARINTTQADQQAKSLKSQAASIAAEYKKQGLNQSDAMKKAWSEIERTTKNGAKKSRKHINDEFTGAVSDLKLTLSRMGSMLMSVLGAVSFVSLAKECLELGSSVAEVQNVVDTAFGSMAYKMEEFSESAITSFGMSQLAAKKTGSNYMAMARGMGLAEDAASDMAIALTGLSGDVASFYNISQDEAATKLKSVFTGETETLKDLGVVMTQANLEQYALSQGITKSISAMTQAEITTLRYNYVLDSLNLASGDFVRTQDSWANQTRILSEQMKQLGANVGIILTEVLIPAIRLLNEIVAYLVEATNAVVSAINVLRGKTSTQNNATASSAAAAADAEFELADGITAAGQAAKKYQAGFDELNVLSSPESSGSSSGGSSVSAGNTMAASAVDDSVAPDLESAKTLLQDIAKYAGLAAAAFGGFKLGSFITDLVTANVEAKTLKETISLFGKKLAITGGITLAVTGIALEGKGIYEAITEGLDMSSFGEILLGGGALTGGLSLALSKILPEITIMGNTISGGLLGGAIGGIAAGIPMFITGIYDSLTQGIDWLSASLTAIGSTLAGAGIGAIIGGPIGAGIGALIGLAVGAITDLFIWLEQEFGFFSDLWTSICDIWDVCAGWFDTNVIQPTAEFFANLWSSISSLASDCWTAIVDFFTPAFEWFSELFSSIYQTLSDVFYNIGVLASGCWDVIKTVWKVVSGWFNSNIVQPVAKFFSGMWEGLKSGASAAWEGIKKAFGTVADFFGDVFGKAWEAVCKVFSPIGDIFVDIKDGILTAFKAVVNGLIQGLNAVIAIPFNGINAALNWIKGINILGITPFSGLMSISVPQIPYLAQGAVIPPNREFLAVLGDQKSGTNIEAPLETIKQALAEVMASQGTGEITINFTGDLAQLGRVLKPVIDTENRRVGGSFAKGVTI